METLKKLYEEEIVPNLTKKFREDSRYEFKSGDWYSNLMVDTGDLDTWLPKIFGENGKYNGWADSINIPDEIKQKIKDRIGKSDKDILFPWSQAPGHQKSHQHDTSHFPV